MSAIPSAVVALAAAMFFRMFGVFAALPIVAPFAQELPGHPAAWAVGFAVGAYGITQALCQIPAGILADRIGRKPALAAALILFILGSILCAAAQHITILIAGRLLQGTGAVAAVVAAWISDLAPAEKRPQAMAIFGAAIGIAFVVSLFAAAPLAGIAGPNGVFAICAAAGILSLLLILPLPNPIRPTSTHDEPINLRRALQAPDLKACALGAFVLHYSMAAMFLQIPLALTDALPLPQHWKIYAPAFALALLPAIPMLKRVGKPESRVFPLAVLLAAVGFIAAVLAGSDIRLVIPALAVFFAGFIALEAALPARAAAAAPNNRRGAAIGLVMTAEFSGIFCGGALSGILLHFAAPPAVAIAAALLFLLWGVVLIRKMPPV